MSLINEALKKAQHKRTEDSTAPYQPTALTPPSTAARQPGMPAQVVALITLVSTLALIGVSALVYFWIKPESPTQTAQAPTPIVTTPTPEIAPVTTQPITPAPVASPAVTLPPIEQIIQNSGTPTIAAVQPTASEVTTPPTPTIETYLDTLRISGVRLSDTDPKVIMNDRIFRQNDVVDRILQLRLIRIEANTLIFTDAHGKEYQKYF